MTKLEQAEAIIAKVEQMRKWQKEYFAHRDALARQGQRKAVQIHIFTAAKTVEDGKQKALERKDKEQGQFLAMTKQ